MTGIGEMKRAAKAQLDGKWLLTTGVLFIGAIIFMALSFTFVGALIFFGILQFGYAAYFLSVTRKQQSDFSLLFRGFDRFGDACLTGILVIVFTFLWSLLFIVPGIIKQYSYSMTFYIMKDNPSVSGQEAITLSRRMMDGHKLDLFVLDLSFIGWFILSVFTFGILAVFYVCPYYYATRANFYEQLRIDFDGANGAATPPTDDGAPSENN